MHEKYHVQVKYVCIGYKLNFSRNTMNLDISCNLTREITLTKNIQLDVNEQAIGNTLIALSYCSI